MGHSGVRTAQDLLPAGILLAGALACLLLGALRPAVTAATLRGTSAAALAAGGLSPLLFLRGMPGPGWHAFGDGLLLDRLTAGAGPVLAGAALVAVLALGSSGQRLHPHLAESLAMVQFAVLGAWLAVGAGEAGALLAALGLLVVSLAVLAGLAKTDGAATATALRVLLLGGLGIALVALGTAVLAATTGTTGFAEAAHAVPAGSNAGVVAAVLLVTGVLLVLGAAALGAGPALPAPVAGLLVALPTVVAVAVLGRLCVTALEAVRGTWTAELVVAGLVLLVLGSLRALAADAPRAIVDALATASVGSSLLGFAAAGPGQGGVTAAVLSGIATAAAVSAAYGVLASLEGRGRPASDTAGLFARAPVHGGVLVVALLSLAGAPPLFGFLGRFAVVTAAVAAGWGWTLVVILPATAAGLIGAARAVRQIAVVDGVDEALHPTGGPVEAGAVAATGVLLAFAAVVGEPLLAAAAAGAAQL